MLTGKGIVYDVESNSPVKRVDVLIDGVAHVAATTSVSRADYCATNKVNGCPYVGFTFSVANALENIGPGKHTLQLRATNVRGVTNSYPDGSTLTFTVEAGETTTPVAKLETPADGATLTGTRNTIRGYVGLTDAKVRYVDVLIDGVTYGAASFGLTRTDVCSTLGSGAAPLDCPRIGFSYTLDTTNQDTLSLMLANGQHKLQVRAIDQYSRVHLIPETPITITVTNEANKLPVVALETAVANQTFSGTMSLNGYAYDPDGKVQVVYLVIDEVYYGGVTYGGDRSAVCAALPDVAACPKIGFTTNFDTKRLTNGPHFLRMVAYDNTGYYTQLPAVTGSGINFFVQN
jgi:hypothetical protein